MERMYWKAAQERDVMRTVLEAYEQWEADLIMDNDAWYDECREPRSRPIIPQPLWDRLIEIQGMRNAALGNTD
jgi:hypothetical protein